MKHKKLCTEIIPTLISRELPPESSFAEKQNFIEDNRSDIIDSFIEKTAQDLAQLDMMRMYELPYSNFSRLTRGSLVSRRYPRVVVKNFERCLQANTQSLTSLLKKPKDTNGCYSDMQEVYYDIRDMAYEIGLFEMAKFTKNHIHVFFTKNKVTKSKEIKEKYLDMYDRYCDSAEATISELMDFDLWAGKE